MPRAVIVPATDMSPENLAKALLRREPLGKRKSPAGKPTSDLLLSAHVATNDTVFPRILDLHVPLGSTVADVTYGSGVFWKRVPSNAYVVKATDIKTGTDCTNLPYEQESIDCVVLDPPYMEGFYRRRQDQLAASGTYRSFRSFYATGETSNGGPKYHNAVLDLYYRSGREAGRVLKVGGTFIVKCQDAVSANVQRLTHVELINAYGRFGFFAKDLFVVVRTNRPGVSRILKQRHARKNHSYFLVFVNVGTEAQGRSNGDSRGLGDQS